MGAPGMGAAPGSGAAGIGAPGLAATGRAAARSDAAGIGAGSAWAGTGSRAGAFASETGLPSRPHATGAVSLPPTPAVGNDWRGSNGWSAPTTGPDGSDSDGAFAAPPYGDAPPSGIRISGVLRQPGRTAPGSFAPGSSPAPFAPGDGADASGRRGRHGSDDVPVVTGVPVGRPIPPPAAPFDVFTPVHRPEQDAPAPAEAGYRQTYPDFGAAPDPASDSSYAGLNGAGSNAAGSPFDDSYQGDGFGTSVGNNGAAGGGYSEADAHGGSDLNGLPRRVRQASLAPELRASTGAASGGAASVAPASAASLSDMRSTLSAMQRGWQQGRSQTPRETEDSAADGE